MQHDATGHCLLVAVRHGLGDRSCDPQDIHKGKLFSFPETPATVANTSIVSQHLGQGTTIESFQYYKPHSLGGGTGSDQSYDMGMIQSSMHR